MALVTSQSNLPDFEYETSHCYTLIIWIQRVIQIFTLILPTPLENIVQVQLLTASINITDNATRCVHIGIEELKNHFTQRGKKDLDDADNHL